MPAHCIYIKFKYGEYLSYGANNSYIKLFLKHISVKEECLKCKYRKFERAGDITIGDYWGYYNGTDSHLWVPEAYSVTGEGADRNPDGRLMKAGSLVSVTYPTGGKTVFEMESNKLEDGSIWGGLRVKSISNYDSDGITLLSYKRYEYQDVRQSVSKDDFSKLYSSLFPQHYTLTFFIST